MTDFQNQLIDETSPYLRQHAHNPVDWYPWNARALEKARDEDKPILLSIGYSACHWCHVMAHESFEDPAVAEVMNELFVNIKVDREERPDLDKIYQASQLLLNQRGGGWPLTMFLTPVDQVPFFGGTYFPKAPMHGLPAFTDLLKRVAGFYRQRRDDIGKQNESMRKALENIFGQPPAGKPLGEAALNIARLQLEHSFDARDGGFGGAPKFPHPTNIERLLRHWAASRNEADRQALHMALFSLQKMARGGIYDHLGGGFCRYSVDGQWMIPHFEKMLYDNGPLLGLCAQAAVATLDAELERAARETAGWAMREMQSPEGGYYSSLDADAEGEEGKFHVWDRTQIEALLEPRDYAIFARRFGLDGPANFEGHWHLRVCADMNDLAAAFNTDEHTISTSLAKSRLTLFDVREQRVHPGRDDKILTSWNALMIKGMATAGRHLEMPECIASAQRSLDFIRQSLWRDGRLLATFKDGKAHLTAYVDDYAFLIDAALELLQARWRSDELAFACQLADALIDHFEDRTSGGFYFTADDHEPLIQRPKVMADEATPAGNGVAAQALARLGFLVGETRYIKAAERTLEAAAGAVAQAPIAHASLLAALEERVTPSQILILRGAGETFDSWHRAAARAYAPRRLVFTIQSDASDLPPALAEKAPDGAAVAYLCEGMTCAAPVKDTKGFKKVLARTSASA